MAFIIISPTVETPWALSAADFSSRLRARWPAAEVWLVPGDSRGRSLGFKIPMQRSVVEGGLDKQGQALIVDHGLDLREIIELGFWFRDLIPGSIAVAICDEGGSGYTMLGPGTTVEDVVRAFTPERLE